MTNEWREIETAPEDRFILLQIEGEWCSGWWDRHEGIGRWRIYFDQERIIEPTGWCELPKDELPPLKLIKRRVT